MQSIWGAQLRVRAWYSIFKVAEAAANQTSPEELRRLMLEALQAIEEAVKAGEY